MINYAHRGASEYAPENTLSSFYLGLLMGANGIETDVQKTRDGALVLFHDDTLDRVTDKTGKLSDYTLNELKDIKVFGNCTSGFYDRILTFREFLGKFSQYDIKFAIELKGEGVEEESLSLIKEFGILEKTTFTSFKLEYLKKMKELENSARIGFLVKDPSKQDINDLLSIGGEEIAPKAENVTQEKIATWRKNNLGIRVWGVSSVALMKKMCEFNVDGMTVNFPDRLSQFVSVG